MKKIVSLVIVLALTLSFCACGGTSPSDVTGLFLDAFKAKDADTIRELYADSEGLGDFDAFLNDEDFADESMPETAACLQESILPKLFEFDYAICDEKIDGDKASVDVEFTAYALGDAMTAAVGEIMTEVSSMANNNLSDEAIDIAMRDIYKKNFDAAEKTYKATATITLSKKGDDWVVDELDEDGEFVDAIFGGMMTAVDNMD